MRIELPANVAYILKTLEDNGFEACAVGGCVRDALMGAAPHDWDICTSALPEQTKACFTGIPVIETGLRHGTITMVLDHEPYEITTYRVDGEYEDNRHPSVVRFTSSLEEDLARRDFTMNAMAYTLAGKLVDPFGGVKDIRAQRVRCVGDPMQRFSEDALRVLRALRFSSVLGFGIQAVTAAAIMESYRLLENVSAERIRAELDQTLMGCGVAQVLLRYSDVFHFIIPEARPTLHFLQNNRYHAYDVWEHIVKSIEETPADRVVRLAMLFHDIAKPACYTQDNEGVGHFYGHARQSGAEAQAVMRRLKYDNATIYAVRELVYYHDSELHPTTRSARKWLNRLGEPLLRRLLAVKRADVLAQAEEWQQERLEALAAFEAVVDEVIAAEDCFQQADLALNGRDLLALGIPAGPEIGRLLHLMLEKVMDEEIANDRDALLAFAGKAWEDKHKNTD